MKIVSEIKTKHDLDEFKSIMEIFIINNRIKEIARNA